MDDVVGAWSSREDMLYHYCRKYKQLERQGEQIQERVTRLRESQNDALCDLSGAAWLGKSREEVAANVTRDEHEMLLRAVSAATDLANKYFECLTECIENLRNQLDAFQKMRIAHYQYKRHMERACCGGARLGPIEKVRR